MHTTRLPTRVSIPLLRSGRKSAQSVFLLLILISAQMGLGATQLVSSAIAAGNSAAGNSPAGPGEAELLLAQVDPEEQAEDMADSEDDFGGPPDAPTDSAAKPTVTSPLEPTYQPRPPVEKSWYNASYMFGMTRGVADSTIAPAGKVPLFFLTVPLDIVFLPFAAIGGLFG